MCIQVPCGYSARTLTRAVALLQICGTTVGLLLFTLLAIVVLCGRGRIYDAQNNSDLAIFLSFTDLSKGVFFLSILFVLSAQLAFSFQLYEGIKEMNKVKLKIWFWGTCLVSLLLFPLFVLAIFFSVEKVNVLLAFFFTYSFISFVLTSVVSFTKQMEEEYSGICILNL